MHKLLIITLLFALSACHTESKSEAKNYILITVDTLRADHLGTQGHKTARTPVIDQLAADGTLFETAIAVAPITMPTHATMMTGLYPHKHGVRNNGSFVLGEEAVTLAERFKKAGYDTGAVTAALVLDSKFGLDQGFRVYDDNLYGGAKQKMFMFKEIKANQAVDKALALATKELREPFFLWLHIFDPHADYEPPPPYDVLFLDQPYDGEVAFVDKELGRFFKELKSAGLAERTLTMLTGDHGDALGEHGEQTHGIFIYRSTTHIPLIVQGPGVQKQRIPGLVSQIDIAPTLAELASLPAIESDGISLASTLIHKKSVAKRQGVFIESINPRLHFGWHELRAIDTGDSKYIQTPKPEYYEFTSDPGEEKNLFEGSASKITSLKATVDKWSAEDPLEKLQLKHVDSETRAMLEGLGYIADTRVATGDNLPDAKDVAYRWENLQKCQALLRVENDAVGAKCLKKILEEDPGNWTAHLSLAGALQRLKAFGEAEKVLKKAIEINPDSTKALQNLAHIYTETKRIDEAIKVLKQAGEISKNDPEPWGVLGDMLESNDRPQEAIAAYSEALKRDDIYVRAYVGIANTFHKIGQSDRALSYLQKATELENANLAAWYNMGVVQDKLGHIAEAEKAYKKASEIDPTHAMTHNNLGSLLNRQGKGDAARQEFLRALKAEPTHVEAKYNLAIVTLEKNPELAMRLLSEVIVQQSDLLQARHTLATIQAKEGKVDEAIKGFSWIVEHTPKAPGAYIAMAKIEVGRGNKGVAKKHISAALKQDEKITRALVSKDKALQPLLSK